MLPKQLIPDANILFSFFRMESERKRVMKELLALGCRLICPEFVFEELKNRKEKILRYSKNIDEIEFTYQLFLLQSEIKTFSEEKYRSFLSKAGKISPHGGDTKGDPYFALALFLDCPIWSDEKAFKEQAEIKIFSTKELLEMLKEKEQ